MSRPSWAVGASAGAWLLGATVAPSALADVRVAPGFQVEDVVIRVPRPIQLAFDGSGRLVILSHGRGDAAAEIHRLDIAGPLPIDAGRAPKVVLPFAEGPRKTVFGSLVVDPRSGDLLLGEENGNRIYRLTGGQRLVPFAVGLHHLVGGGSLAFDGRGRLVVLDFASPEGRLRSEAPLPPALDWLATEAYQGPLVFRLDPDPGIPTPRRLDLLAPLFPKASVSRAAGLSLPRFVSVATSPADELVLLSSLGEVFRLTSDGGLRLLARLPAGHYHRTNLAVAPDGSVFVSSGFHIRELLRISPAGAVSTLAWDLGDPGGLVLDRAGHLYITETALHRIIRIRPVHDR